MPVDLKLLGEKLQRYRSQLELTLDEMSESTGIRVELLQAFEDGRESPTGDQLLILADFLKIDYRILISAEKSIPLERTDLLFRRFGDAFSKQDRWSVQEFLFLCESEQFLQRQLSQSVRKFTFIKRGKYFKGHGEEAASALRQVLGYADHAVPRDVYQDFREIGMHVFRRQLENSNISGLYVNHPSAGDCVLVNYSEDVYRQRFTVAHEAAHAILDREEEIVVSFSSWDSKDLKEVRANTFASRYLMPPSFLQGMGGSTTWDREKLVKWAHDLRVNVEPLLIALVENGVITRETASRLKAAKVPQSKKIDPELPESMAPLSRQRKEQLLKQGLSSHYVSLCFNAYRQDVVTAGRLTELLMLGSDNELQELAGVYKEQLDYGS